MGQHTWFYKEKDKYLKMNELYEKMNRAENYEDGYDELEFYDEPLAIKTYESIYIKKPFMVKDVIEVICSFEKGEDDYDVIANAGYGQTSSMARRSIVGKKGIWKVSPDCIEDITIKVFSDFKKDYPKFNRKNYELLMQAVDNFYENLRNNQSTFNLV